MVEIVEEPSSDGAFIGQIGLSYFLLKSLSLSLTLRLFMIFSLGEAKRG